MRITGGLSVCCLTNDRPAMVAAALALLRAVADEIVVAVDSRVDPRTLGPLLDVADAVVRFEYVDPPERARPWLVSLCRHDAVLSVDGDEVASEGLVAALPGLVADDAVVQTRIARRWCFPDERWWLEERPWWPDFQLRLIRRTAVLDHDPNVHGGVRAAYPARLTSEALYHLVCLLDDVAGRRRRARRYDAQRPGMVAVGGGPMNDTLYVPEHFATRRPVPTSESDRQRIRGVLDAPDREENADVHLPVVTAGEIAEHLLVDPIEAQGYAARVRIVEPDLRTDPGNGTMLVAEITNLGTQPLGRDDSPGVQLRVATRLVDDRAGAKPASWTLTPLPCDIPPGEARLLEVMVSIPDQPGTFPVEMNLVNQRGRWFDCATSFQLAVTTRWGRFGG